MIHEREGAFLPEGTIIRKTDLSTPPNSFEVDAFIIHGKNWKKHPPGLIENLEVRIKETLSGEEQKPFRLRLSKDSRITALAAGIVWEWCVQHQEKPPLLIFSTGQTAGKTYKGKRLESEAEAMIEYMKIRFPHIPDDFIKLEDKSYDTPGNIINSKILIEKLGLRNVGYLTVGYHLPRVSMLMDYYDVPIHMIFPTEQILKRRNKRKKNGEIVKSQRHARFVDAYTRSPEWKKHKRGEATIIGTMAVDPSGQVIGKTLGKVIRHRVTG